MEGMNKEQFLLTLLAEEASEIAQAASKAIRFGLKETKLGDKDDNLTKLTKEIADLGAIMSILEAEKIIDFDNFDVESHITNKLKVVRKYLSYSQDLGMVSLFKLDNTVYE